MNKKKRRQKKYKANSRNAINAKAPMPSKGDCFKFGDPEPVLDGNLNNHLGVWLMDNGRYYSPPVSLTGLAKLLNANAYHGPLIGFKKNMFMRGFKGSSILGREDMECAVVDFHVFANCYFQKIFNGFRELIGLRHLQAINMRRMKEPDRYCMLENTGKIVPFDVGEVVHIKSYDVNQKIYGVPEYMGAIQAMLLNEDATLFRRRYYKNGAHMGYIFYSSSADLDEETQNKVRASIEGSKGLGNFRNMFLHIPNGKDKDIQILPVGDYSTRDDLEKIKNLSRDDIIAAHRVPPAMANIIPTNNGGFGDITKIDAIYQQNEVTPIREKLLLINDFLPAKARVSFDSIGDAGA